ncbi:MAG: PIN domain-containing protein [Spirochaetales bacterium]|jgi:uncharacterized protein|nr:PIN domain-containing protein [Spirochaetales bacterium]
MKLVDANILIYAFDRGSVHHKKCRIWLDSHLNGKRKLGLPWNSLLAFARIVSNPRIYSSPVTVKEAWQQVEEWLAVKTVFVPEPTPDHQAVLGHVIRSRALTGNDLPDAHLAAIALEHGLVLCSTDSDFAKYRDITWENPIE